MQAAISLVEVERESLSLDRFYKDFVRERNGGVVVPRRRRKVAICGLASIHGRKVVGWQGKSAATLMHLYLMYLPIILLA